MDELPSWWKSDKPWIISDCIEVMKGMPDKCVDLVLTDPPYNVGLDYGDSHNDKKENYKEWCITWFNECKRISKGIILSPGCVNLQMWITKIEYPKGIMVRYSPNQCSSSNLGGFNHWEPFLCYGKTNYGKNAIFDNVYTQSDVGEHPCPKTIELFISIIETARPKPEIVFDPFLGSGTTIQATRKTGRIGLGCEINPDYEPIIARRSMYYTPKLDSFNQDPSKLDYFHQDKADSEATTSPSGGLGNGGVLDG